ncbi:MAG: diaminopimelate epimerase [Acidobacteriota bacterium]
MKNIKFTKVQGLGNDFLIIPVDDVSNLNSPGDLAIKMCERNYGAGADGIIFVAPSQNPNADFTSRIFNADGSEPEISGNGTRCVAAYLYHQNRWAESEVKINTVAGIKTGRLVSRDELQYEFEFDMGAPKLTSAEIPIILDSPLSQVVNHPLKMGGDIQRITCVSMGNPHCTTFWSSFDDVNIDELGPLLEHHPAFPMRTNVEFVRIISRNEIEVRFWERGVGRTLSSGTGSSGASIAAMLNGFVDRNISVKTQGGTLKVHWRDDNLVMLTGSAAAIYEGIWLAK